MSGMRGLRLDTAGIADFLGPAELAELGPAVADARRALREGTCPGADFLGWRDLPADPDPALLARLDDDAGRARDDAEVYVVIGIGGSYLGARAVQEALGAGREAPEVVYAGTGLCGAELAETLARIRDREVRLCVISKSGTTLEPAVAFRVLRAWMQERYGRAGSARRITAVTDARRGALRGLAESEGYETFVIPDDVGGRFSVLTPVGLLPLAVGGVDVRALLDGAAEMRRLCQDEDLLENPANRYAAVRSALYRRGRHVEVLSTFDPRLRLLGEWWKQLFGESEGKGGEGILPTSTVMTTDLHSLGQYIQDGRRMLMETFLTVRETAPGLVVPAEPGGEGRRDLDGLDDLVGRPLDEINRLAFEGTRRAHVAGGVPCLAFELERIEPRLVGGLLYLFEASVAVSGLLLGVNPFDQPGVEAYKREMYRLLGRS